MALSPKQRKTLAKALPSYTMPWTLLIGDKAKPPRAKPKIVKPIPMATGSNIGVIPPAGFTPAGTRTHSPTTKA